MRYYWKCGFVLKLPTIYICSISTIKGGGEMSTTTNKFTLHNEINGSTIITPQIFQIYLFFQIVTKLNYLTNVGVFTTKFLIFMHFDFTMRNLMHFILQNNS